MNLEIQNSAVESFRERLAESERFHMGTGNVHRTLEMLAADLDAAGIPYAVVGGMALNAHGYARETVDVDVLVAQEGLASFRDSLVGRGYRPAFKGARKTFLNTKTGTRVEFLTAGDYPGDGKPKPVDFPDPVGVVLDVQGIKVVNLVTLINLKLASGMTLPSRRRDLADVQDLIRVIGLERSFAESLNSYVRDTFLTLVSELDSADPHTE